MQRFQILKKQQLNEQVVSMTFHAPYIAAKAQAGQFIIFRLDDHGERVPLTIADYDRTEGTISVIFQPVGSSTKMLAACEVGDCLADLVGPLGNATDIQGVRRAIVVGGGVGCAIAYPTAKALKEAGADVTAIIGFRNKDLVILEQEFSAVCHLLAITTDDGSYSRKGFVTDVLRELLAADHGYDLVIAIGPVPMMKFVSKTTEPFGVKALVSLNPIMIDGTGMCGGCRVTVGGQTKFACVDGPDFDGHQVDFDELMRRNRFYQEEEVQNLQHVCRLTGGARRV